jgi:pimeloyl-ACP methyl ester carboxylesterase
LSGWFEAALAVEPERRRVSLGEVAIETLAWGRRGDPGILLVHGFAAHADWWSFIAPLLMAGRRVVALSLSGMGRSSWRPAYRLEDHTDELIAVAEATGLFDGARPPLVAAHSFGGFASIAAVARDPSRWWGLVLIDTMIDDAFRSARERDGRRPRQMLGSEAEILARFRLLPPQDCANAEIVGHVARRSVVRVEQEGETFWSWATDPNLHVDFEGRAMEPMLRGITCPVALVMGEHSALMTERMAAISRAAAPEGTPLVVIPEAAHHVLLDQPLALVSVLRTFAALWQPVA